MSSGPDMQQPLKSKPLLEGQPRDAMLAVGSGGSLVAVSPSTPHSSDLSLSSQAPAAEVSLGSGSSDANEKQAQEVIASVFQRISSKKQKGAEKEATQGVTTNLTPVAASSQQQGPAKQGTWLLKAVAPQDKAAVQVTAPARVLPGVSDGVPCLLVNVNRMTSVTGATIGKKNACTCCCA